MVQARDCLDFYCHLYTQSQLSSDPESDVNPEHQASDHASVELYLDVFNRWVMAFKAMTTALDHSMSDQEKHAVQTLKMKQLGFQSSLDLLSRDAEFDNQMLWDNYNATFEHTLDIAESLLQASSPQVRTSSPKRKTFFTLDVGIVESLYDVAHRCRDPLIRRRAIRLLYAYPRQEGMWDGVLAARVAERIVEIEESGLGVVRTCADVPDWARTSEACPIFDPEHRKAILCYQRAASAERNFRAPVREVIQW